MIDLSVVIPLYNEAENMGALYHRTKAELEKLHLTYEIIFVDDGSTDGTTEQMKEIKKSAPQVKLVIFCKNYGQTEAIAAGFEVARGEIIVTMDGDLQNDPADIAQIITAVQSGYHVVCGWRKARKDNLLLRKVPSVIANALISYVSKVKIRDLGCSLKGFRREVVDHIYLYSEMHRFIPIVAASMGSRITEIPVNHSPRFAGKSKYGLSRTWKVLLDLMKIKFLVDFSSSPTTRFGLWSLPFWLLGIIFVSIYSYDFFTSQILTDQAVFILGTGALYIFLAFTLVSFGYLTKLIIRTGDYKQNEILGDLSWLQK